MSQSSQFPQTAQVSKWCFTLNNYVPDYDYVFHLKRVENKVHRGVIGREVAPQTGTPHLQGYIEFWRSVRLAHARKVLHAAHWTPARGTSVHNYDYCVKDGDFDIIGDFSAEQAGEEEVGNRRKTLSVSQIIRGLLDPECASQIKVSKAFADRYSYYERITADLKKLIHREELFEEWQTKLLYPWQYEILKNILEQGPREILWIVDHQGNSGKTYVCMFISILYNFQYLDGTVNSRDVASLLDTSARGIVMDVSRASLHQFDYSVLEQVKNGWVTSGKYRGFSKIFKKMKIAVFANGHPNRVMLSEDRWNIIDLSQQFPLIDRTAAVSSKARYPYVKPPSFPELSDDFDFVKFVETRLPNDGTRNHATLNEKASISSEVQQTVQQQREIVAPTRLDNFHMSQTAGPSIIVVPVGDAVRQNICTLHKRDGRCYSIDLVYIRLNAFLTVMFYLIHTTGNTYRKGCPCKTKSSSANRFFPENSTNQDNQQDI